VVCNRRAERFGWLLARVSSLYCYPQQQHCSGALIDRRCSDSQFRQAFVRSMPLSRQEVNFSRVDFCWLCEDVQPTTIVQWKSTSWFYMHASSSKIQSRSFQPNSEVRINPIGWFESINRAHTSEVQNLFGRASSLVFSPQVIEGNEIDVQKSLKECMLYSKTVPFLQDFWDIFLILVNKHQVTRSSVSQPVIQVRNIKSHTNSSVPDPVTVPEW
jgi:hypothetical protein